MYNNLPKQEISQIFKGSSNKQKFYEQLPQNFKRADAIALGNKFGFGNRTIDSLLKKLQPSHLISTVYGEYTKVK